MGQRHQIYMKVNTYNNDQRIVGIHHQWLYGHTAGYFAGKALQFLNALVQTDEETGKVVINDYVLKSSPERVLQAIYNIDHETGYYKHCPIIGDFGECDDPSKGDNNNGITVFDATDLENLKYCMMVFPWEEAEKPTTPYQAISVRSYVRQYYPQNKDWVDGYLESRLMLVKESRAALLTTNQLKGMFPAMTMEVQYA